jgi:hypothetical protein
LRRRGGIIASVIVSHDSAMTAHTPTSVSVILDGLYRWKWWISGVLCAVLIFVVGAGGSDPLTWMLFGAFALLLWVPVLVRWRRAVRGARNSFREGLDGR